jgi:hypothetical protein
MPRLFLLDGNMKKLLFLALAVSFSVSARQPFIPDSDDALYNSQLQRQATERAIRQAAPIDNARQIDDYRRNAPAVIPDTGDKLYDYQLRQQMERR